MASRAPAYTTCISQCVCMCMWMCLLYYNADNNKSLFRTDSTGQQKQQQQQQHQQWQCGARSLAHVHKSTQFNGKWRMATRLRVEVTYICACTSAPHFRGVFRTVHPSREQRRWARGHTMFTSLICACVCVFDSYFVRHRHQF